VSFSNTLVRPSGACPWCSGETSWVMHGGRCPQVRAIEYNPDGSVKRVEFTNTPWADPSTEKKQSVASKNPTDAGSDH